MKASTLFRRWKRRYLSLEKEQWRSFRTSIETGDADAIHDLRVSLRRLRLMQRVGRPLFRRGILEEHVCWSRQVSDDTSRIRDCDVALDWLRQHHASHGLAQSITDRRSRLWRGFRRRHPILQVPARRTLSGVNDDPKRRRAVVRRFENRWDRIQQELESTLPSFFLLDAFDRHQLRRKLRNLRYLRELRLSRRAQSSDLLLRRILRTQVAMGEIQNLQIARTAIRQGRLGRSGSHLRRLLDDQEKHCITLIRRGIRLLTGVRPLS